MPDGMSDTGGGGIPSAGLESSVQDIVGMLGARQPRGGDSRHHQPPHGRPTKARGRRRL
ncbi:MAG: hypothetical protein WKH64_04060 [Chloroflexia bacterium]